MVGRANRPAGTSTTSLTGHFRPTGRHDTPNMLLGRAWPAWPARGLARHDTTRLLTVPTPVASQIVPGPDHAGPPIWPTIF